jgi:hypothetical protein
LHLWQASNTLLLGLLLLSKLGLQKGKDFGRSASSNFVPN